ncbi:DnaJ domain-containing protein [Polychytrium aggregatum]|uniref:DnaJ domain-containing protein n=1 Tax=Polychytrium aggregatum TaxID=110093 RepID=UPI0022FE3401|nr:DnaJ domain-containing protein [Polychytrium aggregatum]KAI9209209.1 DnaJ domain-containing protein [Polychytrium aggregatum]
METDEIHDYYAILGIDPSTDSKAIAKAYRRLALTCHPDKVSPDDTDAAARFLLLSKAYDTLTDPQKRRTYDEQHKARLAKLEKLKMMDETRRKTRQDLFDREKQARQHRNEAQMEQLRQREQIERLREEGERQRKQHEQEQQLLFKQMQEAILVKELQTNIQSAVDSAEEFDSSIRVKWDKKKYLLVQADIEELFEKYGDIQALIFKEGNSIVAFQSIEYAMMAMDDYGSEQTILGNFKLQWFDGSETPASVRRLQAAYKHYQTRHALLSDPAKAAAAAQHSTSASATVSPDNRPTARPEPLAVDPSKSRTRFANMSLEEAESVVFGRIKRQRAIHT